TLQIAGYVEGLKQEYPQKEYPDVKISQYVIYCFGNTGFRVFEVVDRDICRDVERKRGKEGER
ncbi:MAG: hypothetical protein HQK67_05205, partial [Desulfamplus sp.]|nr:hypothetical protein [Desulfamplus sp.]